MIGTIEEVFGHCDVSTTMSDTHVLNQDGRGVRSPLDVMGGRMLGDGDRPQGLPDPFWQADLSNRSAAE